MEVDRGGPIVIALAYRKGVRWYPMQRGHLATSCIYTYFLGSIVDVFALQRGQILHRSDLMGLGNASLHAQCAIFGQ